MYHHHPSSDLHISIQIVELQEDHMVQKYYVVLAQHYAQIHEYATAEKFYVRANMHKSAVEMYTSANKYEAAYQLALKCMQPDDVSSLYISHAEKLEGEGRYKDAEKLYITIDEADLAINMYKRLKMYDQMMRLVKVGQK